MRRRKQFYKRLEQTNNKSHSILHRFYAPKRTHLNTPNFQTVSLQFPFSPATLPPHPSKPTSRQGIHDYNHLPNKIPIAIAIHLAQVGGIRGEGQRRPVDQKIVQCRRVVMV